MRLIFIFIPILICISCKSKYIINNDAKIIINKVIKLKGLSNGVYDKDYSLNKNLLKLLYENVTLENGEYTEFGDLRNIIADSVLNDIFNEFEFKKLVSQLENDSLLKSNKQKKLIINTYSNCDLNPKNRITYTLSEPIFFTKNPYVIIMYSYSNRLKGIGGSGVVLFKKINNEWVFINEFWNTMT